MNKTVVKIALAVIIATGIWGGIKSCQLNQARSEIARLQVSSDSTRQLADSAKVRLASTELDRDSLKEALSTANLLNAQLIAAARIRVKPRVDSGTIVIQPRDTGQTRFPILDSLETGIFHGELTVSPPPDFVQLDYQFDPFPLDLTVSVLQMKDRSAVFAVKYRGGEATIEAPFARIPEKAKFITTYAEGLYNPFDRAAALRAGIQSHIPFLRRTNVLLIVEAEQRFRAGNESSIYLGMRKVF